MAEQWPRAKDYQSSSKEGISYSNKRQEFVEKHEPPRPKYTDRGIIPHGVRKKATCLKHKRNKKCFLQSM